MPPLPPGLSKEQLERIPPRFREDAIQEAWVAHLEGRKPWAAVVTFLKREKRHEEREIPYSQLPDEIPGC